MPREDLIQLRRGTAAQWTTANPVLADGEKGIETDTLKEKIGDGVTAWNSLSYFNEGGGGSGTVDAFSDVANGDVFTPSNYTVDPEDTSLLGQLNGVDVQFGINNNAISLLQSTKQDNLVSGSNIKTVNGESLLGAGDLTVSGGSLTYETEITTSTTLSTQEGLNAVYPVNSSSAVVITVPESTYSANDVVNFERRGTGSVEFVGATDNVRIRGVRDLENRYFINDRNSIVSLLFRSANEATIIGRLSDGYTGAVTTSSYGDLNEGDTGVDVTVIGTGFSDNMLVTVSANATLNSFTFVSPTEVTLNLTAVGVETDTVTVTYDNGDVFVDTDAITIGAAASSYITNLVASYNFNSDATDFTGNNNGTATGVTFATGKVGNAAIFGSGDNVTVPDSNDFTFYDGANDTSFSLSLWVRFTTAIGGGTRFIVSKRDGTDFEWALFVFGGNLRIALYSQNGTGNQLINEIPASGNIVTNTWHHVLVTYDGSGTTGGLTMRLDDTTNGTSSQTGTYVEMNNTASDVYFGIQAPSSSNLLGDIDECHFWKNRIINGAENTDIYTTENGGSSIL